jgi:hypothetical protein
MSSTGLARLLRAQLLLQACAPFSDGSAFDHPPAPASGRDRFLGVIRRMDSVEWLGN